jgi:predicted MPP superfamily phosphohydrolase
VDPIPDFSKRRNFPGTLDNEFDVILRRVDDVEKIPTLLFAILLFLLALLPTFERWWWTDLLYAFFLGDWLLMAGLARSGRSFGPAKPPTLILTLMRMVFAFLPPVAAIPLQVIGTLLVIYAFWIEPHTIHVTHQSLQTPKLAAGQPPIRVLHLGDLHIERITARERQLNALIRELKPDIILFSGDVLNLSYIEDPLAWAAARTVLSEWQAPHGVFVVTGSPAVDMEHVFPRLVEDLPLRWLRDERVTITLGSQAIDVIGLTCTHKPFLDDPRLIPLAESVPQDRFTILLYHTPDLAPNADRTGRIDLQFSGHTHGGQIRLPGLGAFFAASLYGKRFEAGRYQLANMTLYVTRGIGLEGKAAPRVRFLTSPEIILWEISGSGSTQP